MTHHAIKIVSAAVFAGLAFILSLPAAAETQLSATDLKALVSDKTVHARHEKNKFKFSQFFEANGSLRQLTDSGEKKAGVWYVESDGTLCVKFDDSASKTCGPVIASGDGTYKRMMVNPRNIMGSLIHWVTFERFESGNPQGL